MAGTWTPRDPKIAAELDRLHAAARASVEARHARGGFIPEEDTGDLIRLGSEYLSLSPDEGQFAYMMARTMQAQRIVEFGASYGISTLYFAAALRETGGTLVTTEVHPDKCRALRDSFARAGVTDIVTLLEGDARETLKPVEGPIDMLFLDGWKSMYLPVFRLLTPRLRPGALILADNVSFAEAQDFVAASETPPNATQRLGDMSVTVFGG